MGAKSILATVLVLPGVVGLIKGMFGIFCKNLSVQSPWIFAILGFIFFLPESVCLKVPDPKA